MQETQTLDPTATLIPALHYLEYFVSNYRLSVTTLAGDNNNKFLKHQNPKALLCALQYRIKILTT